MRTTQEEREQFAAIVKDHPRDKVSLRLFGDLVNVVLQVKDFVHEINEKNVHRNARLDTLEARLAEVESRQALEAAKAHVNFCGTFTPGRAYGKGDAVTRSGALWIALEPTTGVPGGTTPESRSWQLAVKSGAA